MMPNILNENKDCPVFNVLLSSGEMKKCNLEEVCAAYSLWMAQKIFNDSTEALIVYVDQTHPDKDELDKALAEFLAA
jgi:hypothetical protein